jgi:hypothetical protein
MSAADRPSGPLGITRRTVLAIIAASAVIGLAACGSTVAGGDGHLAPGLDSHSKEPAAASNASVGVPLCAATHKVDRVVVSPAAARSASYLHRILPRRIMIGDVPRVRALAGALCALPPMPATLHCPADFGGAFRLTFMAGRRGFDPVRDKLSGCRSVTGAGPARWWLRAAGFGRLLSRALGGTGSPISSRLPSAVPAP